jgi:hypothetical protein
MVRFFEWVEEQYKKVEEAIRSVPQSIDDISNKIESKIHKGIIGAVDEIAGVGKSVTQPAFEEIIKQIPLPDNLKKSFKEYFEHEGELGMSIPDIFLGNLLAGLLLSSVSSSANPLFYQIQTEAWERMRFRNLDYGEALRLWIRELLSNKEFERHLKEAGFNDELIHAIKEGAYYYPSAGDFIRFAVRDTFREDVVEKYQYDAEYPKQIEEYAKKAGFRPEWLKHYWRAHWELPSITLGYEMLHRGVITEDDLRTLLKIADIAPYWIHKTIQVSYSPYTRVDVRRMYRDGVLTREQVKRAYKDIGYDDEHAENLTVWTTKQSLAKERDLTKTEIKTAYLQGEITQGEAIEHLQGLGYDEDEADLILTLAEYQEEKRMRDYEIRVLKKEYAKGLITGEKLKKSLQALGLSEKYMDLIMRESMLSRRENNVGD